jgi:hypothetical protein
MPPVTSKTARRIGASCCKEENNPVSALSTAPTIESLFSRKMDGKTGINSQQASEKASKTTRIVRIPINR